MRSPPFPQLLAVATLLAATTGAHAYCLGPNGCETDDSVCDLGRNSTTRIGHIQFVPADAPNEKEIYLRMGKATILAHCTNRQLLLLHSRKGTSFDSDVLGTLAKTFCPVASIHRTTIEETEPSDNGGQRHVGFEIRCPITKMVEAKAAYEAAEGLKSTEALVAEANAPQPAASSPSISLAPDPNKLPPECRTVGLGSLLGFSGRCAK